MIANSIKTQADTMNPAVEWLSRNPTLYGYELAYQAMEYLKSLWNTVNMNSSALSSKSSAARLCVWAGPL